MTMHRTIDAKALADRYFPGKVTTADKIAPPTPKPTPAPTPIAVADSHPDLRKSWPAKKMAAFDLLSPTGIYCLATEGPITSTEFEADGITIKKRFGHNRLCWPVKIGNTSSWVDNITRNKDTGPTFRVKVQARVWLPGVSEGGPEASQLAYLATDWLAVQREKAGTPKLYHGYEDLITAFDLDTHVDVTGDRHPVKRLVLEMLMLARRQTWVAWDDDGLSLFLDRALKASDEKGIQLVDGRGRRIGGDMGKTFVKLCDRLVERERERQFPGRQ